VQIGISAPQGCGKTTLVTELEKLLVHEGLPCASVSIDDFYLTRADQAALAQAHEDNWLLQGRGHAGTHDMALGTKTLQDLNTCRYGRGRCAKC
jgi:D-glycerate 3-kinase